jgi:hypothetical protein
MGATRHEIESHIEAKRDELRSNLYELEARVKSVVDWREHFRSNPGAALGLAFGSGLLLARLWRGAGRRNGHERAGRLRRNGRGAAA